MKLTVILLSIMFLTTFACAQHVTLVANSVDLSLVSGSINSLSAAGFSVQTITASELDSHKNDSNIFILGGQNAPEGIGPIVSGILNDGEKAQLLSKPDARMQVIIPNVWTTPQKVRIFAGYEKEQTRLALSENLNDVIRAMKFNDSAFPQNSTSVIVPVPPIDSTQPYTEVNAYQANSIIQTIPGLILMDVRGVPFYDAGHIPGALSRPERTLSKQLDSLDPNATYLLYCGGNSESIAAGNLMHAAGFKNIYRLVDGYVAWRWVGFPKERTPLAG